MLTRIDVFIDDDFLDSWKKPDRHYRVPYQSVVEHPNWIRLNSVKSTRIFFPNIPEALLTDTSLYNDYYWRPTRGTSK